MTAPVWAILWQIGWRRRFGLALSAAYFLTAALIAALLPSIFGQANASEDHFFQAGQLLALPCGFIVTHLLAVFSAAGAEFQESGYPRRMFILPVRTRILAVWPMLSGGLVVGCAWLVIARFILQPTGIVVPFWWPATALIAGLALLQAVSWMPLSQGWLRGVIALPALLVLAMGVVLLALLKAPAWLAAGIFLGLLPILYAVALKSVTLARRGDELNWRLGEHLTARLTDLRKPNERPFSSVARAQLWFECRRFAGLLPLYTALTSLSLIVVILMAERGSVEAGWRILATVAFLPALLAVFIGGHIGNATFPFLASRPVSTVALVRAKLAMALVSALLAHVPILLLLPFFLLRPGMVGSAVAAAQEAGFVKAAMVLVVALVVPVIATWNGLIQNLWVALADRPWLTNAFAAGFGFLFLTGTPACLWVWLHPESQPFFWSLMPWLVAIVLVCKLIVALLVLGRLLRSRLVTSTTVGSMVGGWCVIATALCFLALRLNPALPARSTIAMVALFVPFSRLAGAPLALAWNRHR